MFGLSTLARVASELRRDVAAAHQRDPAARGVSSTEILASWPGVHALISHRIAHLLYEAGVPVAPRSIAYVSRSITGVEIVGGREGSANQRIHECGAAFVGRIK